MNKKSEQKSAINGLVTAIVGCYINLNFTDSGIILIAANRIEGVTISITLTAVVILMIIGIAVQKGRD